MGNVMSYSGLTTKIRAMQAKLLTQRDYESLANLGSVPEAIEYLKEKDIQAVFHYIPLHSAPAGERFGRFHGEDVYTTRESERLLRLPMFYGLKEEQVRCIADKVTEFYR